MNWEALGAIGELIGALVVVGSVIYLSRQVRETNKHANAEVERHAQETWNHYIATINGNDKLMEVIRRGYGSFNSLSDSDKMKFLNCIAQFVNHLEMILRMESKGLISKDMADFFRRLVLSLIATPGGREFWAISKSVFQKLSAIYIDENLNNPQTIAISELFPFMIDHVKTNE